MSRLWVEIDRQLSKIGDFTQNPDWFFQKVGAQDPPLFLRA